MELLENYSIEQIIIFIVLICTSVKAIICFIDWAIERTRKIFDKEAKEEEAKESIEEKILELSNKNKEIEDGLKVLPDKLNILIESDKVDIKAWIVEKHHYFVEEKESIDYQSLDSILKRYKHYSDEGGNSFVSDLVKEIESLPKDPPKN